MLLENKINPLNYLDFNELVEELEIDLFKVEVIKNMDDDDMVEVLIKEICNYLNLDELNTPIEVIDYLIEVKRYSFFEAIKNIDNLYYYDTFDELVENCTGIYGDNLKNVINFIDEDKFLDYHEISYFNGLYFNLSY